MNAEDQALSRRRVLRRVAAAAALAGGVVPVSAGSLGRRQARSLERTLTAFFDTLLPADELTPAASTFGIAAIVLADARGNALYQRLLRVATAWLDDQAGGDFTAQPQALRDALLQAMAQAPWNSPQGRFFQLMRDLAMAEYYSQPASWRGLALDRPPQPLGFMDAVS